MIPIKTLDFPGEKSVIENIETYRQMFLDFPIIAFRGAYCDRSSQEKIMKAFGDVLDWWPNSTTDRPSNYEETHHNHMRADNKADKNSLMLGWHLEHIQQNDDIYVGASWCMNLFKCAPDAGITYFVDMLDLFYSLPEEEQKFLNSAVVTLKAAWGPHEKTQEDVEKLHTYKFVQTHRLLKKSVLRPLFDHPDTTNLASINGADPTEEEKVLFKTLLIKIQNEVYNNEDIRHAHSWQEGDMVISDMFRLAHAVGGGFSENERRLDGIFGRFSPK